MKFTTPSSAVAFLMAGTASNHVPLPSHSFQYPTPQYSKSVLPSPELRPSRLYRERYSRDYPLDDFSESFVGSSKASSEKPLVASKRREFLLNAACVLTAASVVGAGGETALADGPKQDVKGGNNKKNGSSPNKRLGGMAKKIRSVCNVMDELQRDLMQERWDLVEKYPEQLRSYVPLFTTFTDSAFPSDDVPSDKGLRVALRYEVGRFFASLERLRQATNRRALDEAYEAFANMSLHLDRYMHVGGLYTYYDDMVSTEELYKGVDKESIIHADPVKDPALVRDLIVLIKGPDMGKTGIVIGLYPDGASNCVVKLDKYKGMREIRVVPQNWAAKRLGEQDPDEVFLIPRKSS